MWAVIWCFNKKLCMRRVAWAGLCCDEAAHSCGLLNHLNSFHGGMFKLNPNSDEDSLLYQLSHFECDSHTLHGLSQRHLPPLLTSMVKPSLFTHAHSSPLSLATRLPWCLAKCSLILTMAKLFLDKPHILSHCNFLVILNF